MFRFGLTLILASILGSSCFAKFEIKNVQASHGPYGPERSSLEVLPQDELFFRFQILGAKTNSEGKTDIEETIKLTDKDGKTLLDKPRSISRQVLLGGDELTSYVFISINPKAAPGDYNLTVTLKDKIAGETASFEKKIVCKATSFAVLAPRFYRDAEGKVPGPVGGLVNETVHFKLYCVGFDKKDKQVRVLMSLQVLDDQGKEILPKPIEVKGYITKADEAEKAIKLTFDGSLILTRPGDFKLRITLEDQQGKQSAKFETPLKVTAP